MSNKPLKVLAYASAFSLLAACGGGSDDSDSSSFPEGEVQNMGEVGSATGIGLYQAQKDNRS